MLQPENAHEQIRTYQGRKEKLARRASADERISDHLEDGAVFEPLYAAAAIDEVLGVLKSGKEATVYVARAGEDLLAIKVYRPREHRTFRNAAVYDDGRQHLDPRIARAVRSKTTFGREAEQYRWVGREMERLCALYDVGVAVPRPIRTTGSAIVMAYLGNEDAAAPRLIDVDMDPEEAERAWRWMLYDIELMLGANVVHADLSPYNVLWWEGRAWIIDFPQACDPRFNRSARDLLVRDVRNVGRWFQRHGVDIDPQRVALDLWRRFMRAEL